MPKIKYQDRKFSPDSLKVIDQCNAIITAYTNQGFVLTLRQLYYQMVSRDLIPNKLTEYKRLGSIVNDARLAGLIDWDAIEDRTRNVRSLAHWNTVNDIVATCARQFRLDLWDGQSYRPEIWIEKDALVGVIEGVCNEYDVPYFSCRGYTSQSEMWGAAMRLREWQARGQTPLIFHFGDHDPSGKDMTRDIVDRLNLFMGGCELERLALNMDQVRQYNPPPNPAKITDSRFAGYMAEFGAESWELDALEPAVIADLIRNALDPYIDTGVWNDQKRAIEQCRKQLELASNNWRDVVNYLNSKKK